MILFLESIGIGEIVVVLFFILLFFGADKLPGIAQKLGRGIRQIKDMTQDIQDEFTKTTMDMRREMNANQAIEELKESLENPAREIAKNLNKEGGEISQSLNRSIKFEKKKPAEEKTNTPKESVSKTETSENPTKKLEKSPVSTEKDKK